MWRGGITVWPETVENRNTATGVFCGRRKSLAGRDHHLSIVAKNRLRARNVPLRWDSGGFSTAVVAITLPGHGVEDGRGVSTRINCSKMTVGRVRGSGAFIRDIVVVDRVRSGK